MVRFFQGESAAAVAGVGLVLGGVGAWVAGRVLRAAWVRDYKAAAIARMVAQLGHDLQYRQKGHRAMVSFDCDKLYVAVPLGRLDDAFEPTLFKPLTDTAALQAHLETLRLMAGMAEALAPQGAATGG